MFYEDIFEEFSRFGKIEELEVCDNIADFFHGNVYVKYAMQEQASEALSSLRGLCYEGMNTKKTALFYFVIFYIYFFI